MSRLCRLGFLAVCLTSFSLPASVEAGLGSWTQVPILAESSVGQIFDYYTGYTPYYAGYTPYYGSYTSYYGPYSSGYSPGMGCNCAPSYALSSCGCSSPCYGNCGTGCASGNCSTGCATTTTNSSAGALRPIPDPANSTSVENRLQVIERALNITPPARNNRTYAPDNFNSTTPNRNRNDATNPNRDSSDPDNFQAPTRPRGNGTGTGTGDDGEMFRENTGTGSIERNFKAPIESIAIPGEAQTIQTKKPAPGDPIDDKDNQGTEKKKDQTLRLDSRIVSRAVSPRERLGGRSATESKSNTVHMDAHPRTVNVARY